MNEIEEAMDKIDDLKLEIDGKEDKFGLIVEAGEQMVEEGHHATEEVGGSECSLPRSSPSQENLDSLNYGFCFLACTRSTR